MKSVIIQALVLLAILAIPVISAWGVEQEPVNTESRETEFRTAPVEIDGQLLFLIRGASSLPAEQRADGIKERIEAVASDKGIRSDSLTIDNGKHIATIMAGKRPIMIIGDADARMEQMSRVELARLHLFRIRKAIDDYRLARDPETVKKNVLYSGGATIILLVGISLMIWLRRAVDRVLARRVQARIHSLGIQSFEIVRAERIWGALRGSLYTLAVIATLVMIFIYLEFVLRRFPWTSDLANRLVDLVLSPLGQIGKAIVTKVPDLIFLAVLVLIFRFVLKLFRLFFDAIERGNIALEGFEPEWAMHTYKIVRFALVAFCAIVAYPYIPGSQSAAFKGVSLFIGVVFSLGSSSFISNLIAGYMMTYRRAFRVGDRVQVGEITGFVTAMRLQVTHLRSLKNEEVIIPNSHILGTHVINYSSLAATQGLVLHTKVGIGYETPWRQVEAMLLMAAERTPGLLREPPPFVLQKELGDFAVTYELNVYCNNAEEMNRQYTMLHRSILDVFNEYGIQIMTPAYESDADEPKVVPRDQWYAAPATPEGDQQT